MAMFYIIVFIIACIVPYIDEKIYAKQKTTKEKLKTENISNVYNEKKDDFIELKKNRKGIFEV